MENRIKQSYTAVVAQATQALAGVEQHEVSLSLSLVSAEGMSTNLNQLTAGETKTIQAKAELQKRQLALRTAMMAARNFLFVARDLLKTRLGKKYSSAWDEAGFLYSIEVPRQEEKVLSVLQALSGYFTKHADHANAPLNVTAAQATGLWTALISARTALNSQKTAWQLAMSERNTKLTEARRQLRALLKELAVRLTPTDERWASFGFNRPGQKQKPEVPQKLEAVLVGSTAATMKWERAPRATYYHAWKKVVGVDPDFMLVGSPADLDFTMEQLPSNALVEVAVSAVNPGGESLRSKVVLMKTVGSDILTQQSGEAPCPEINKNKIKKGTRTVSREINHIPR